MSRQMGDATHDNAPALAAVQTGLAIIAGYDTGTMDIVWTAASWALFPGKQLVTIDQGAAFSPVPSSTVRDVETGAWTAAAAVDRSGWNAARPTIYCNESTLPAVLAAGWQGDLWLAIPGWQPGQPLPAAPGCVIVAVQDQLDAGGGTYDLSTVIDPYWPLEAPVQPTISGPWNYCNKCECLFYGPNIAASACAAGGPHNPPAVTGSLDYWLTGQASATS